MAKVTLQMIADKLGVSKGLVSIALSDRYGVNAETRSDIVLAAIQMGYDFSRIKKQKESSINNLFYVLTKDIDLHTDRFWPQIIKGIESKATEAKFRIKVKSWDENTNLDLFVSDIVDMRCSGIIIISEIPPFIFSHLILSKIPMILVDGKIMYDDFIDTIGVNNYATFYNATKFVIEKGHKHVAFVGDINYAYSFNQRYLGFKDCVKRYPHVKMSRLVQQGNDRELTDSYNIDALEKSLTERRVDAYLCANDNIAEKIYSFAEKNGIRIPEDISVMGFDDNAQSKFFHPPLSTVNVPKKELGELCFKALVDRIKHRESSIKRINIMCNIVPRESVKQR
jgi:LacI family transcriptional regulator